jgi:hypothetical protein
MQPRSTDPRVTYHGLDLPVVREVDLLVVGGGTAGAIAAVAGAREGLRTLVVEQFGFLGGTQTGATVTPMMPNQLDGEPLNGGIDMELNHRLMAEGNSGRFSDGNEGWFNPEMLKCALDDLATEAGAELLFFTHFVDVLMQGDEVAGAVVHNKAGLTAIRARRVIDATGDADVAVKAGVPFEGGDAEGEHQPLALRFMMGGIDFERFVGFLAEQERFALTPAQQHGQQPLFTAAMVEGGGWPLEPFFRQALEDGVLEPEDLNYFQLFSMNGRPGEVAFNNPRIRDRIDGTDPFDLSHACITGRRMVGRYAAFMQRYMPGCENAYVSQIAPMVGVRETRRIVGEYVLTAEDVLEGRKFSDAIARNNYPIDLHSKRETEAKLVKLPPGVYHEIPYRCLVPLQAENLLVVGRALSATFEAQGSVRIQSNCRAMGEAAGRAMALSLRDGITPREVDGIRLREHLVRHGARLMVATTSRVGGQGSGIGDEGASDRPVRPEVT